ncbi:hypothetical protein [Pseudalkalibacillus berkeleyi]|uniref:Uncharacterized protein n=1 Tax=Pseudalkalibacillus berkeleyi TaxID=1069813 RepID=A0ABS9GYI7_9BACL|nr:hypothetical protein [Pseudalkalibacillus berkeleyi]MCF6136668.1 hypothetical protein [Pseudalkalibacillus berkeleyi]
MKTAFAGFQGARKAFIMRLSFLDDFTKATECPKCGGTELIIGKQVDLKLWHQLKSG